VATADNWNPSIVPGAGTNADIAETDGVNRIITYNYTGSAVTLNELLLDLTNYRGNNTVSLDIPANTLSAESEYVGISSGLISRASINQSGGTNNNLYLFVGLNPSDNGTYSMSSGSLSNDSYEWICYEGSGTFNQTWGTNSSTDLFMAAEPGSSGIYTLESGAALDAFARANGLMNEVPEPGSMGMLAIAATCSAAGAG